MKRNSLQWMLIACGYALVNTVSAQDQEDEEAFMDHGEVLLRHEETPDPRRMAFDIAIRNSGIVRTARVMLTEHYQPGLEKDIIYPKPTNPIEVKALEYIKEMEFYQVKSVRHASQVIWRELYHGSHVEDSALSSEYFIRFKAELAKLPQFNWKSFENKQLKRLFAKYEETRRQTISVPNIQVQVMNIVNKMKEIYSSAKICHYKQRNKCDLSLEPEILAIFDTSRDPNELAYYWAEWRRLSGLKLRPLYEKYVKLSNQVSIPQGFPDKGAEWRDDFEMPNLPEEILKIWQKVQPLYLQLHAYVRFKLRQKYGPSVVPPGASHIPAHILGNVWAQNWRVQDLIMPYPEEKEPNIAEGLKKMGFDVPKMFKLAEDFYTSLGFEPMTKEFWENTIMVKPNISDFQCHPFAFDFSDGHDFRVKMCARVNDEFFSTIHHEMGHIVYYMQYRKQPFVFRKGANPGFHEAIGDTISLSVETQKHKFALGLVSSPNLNEKKLVNFLMRKALLKVAFLPYSYVLSTFRWKMFQGLDPSQWNCEYWASREGVQGLTSPIPINPMGFDAGAKYHVPGDSGFVAYFVATILQFQFYKALCTISGQYLPNDPNLTLQNCDFYKSKLAGESLSDMLSLGLSKIWSEQLEQLTGRSDLDHVAILDYFDPLHQWLKAENIKNNEPIGFPAHSQNWMNSCSPKK